MTDQQKDDLGRVTLRMAAALAAILAFAITVWVLEQLTGSSPEGALRIGLLFVAIFGGSAVVRLIGDLVFGLRRKIEHDEREDKP